MNDVLCKMFTDRQVHEISNLDWNRVKLLVVVIFLKLNSTICSKFKNKKIMSDCYPTVYLVLWDRLFIYTYIFWINSLMPVGDASRLSRLSRVNLESILTNHIYFELTWHKNYLELKYKSGLCVTAVISGTHRLTWEKLLK